MRDEHDGRGERRLAGAPRTKRQGEAELLASEAARPQPSPGRATLTQQLAPAPDATDDRAELELELQLARAGNQLIALQAANRTADPHTSCEAAGQLRSALRTAEEMAARTRGRAATKARVAAMREECRGALELAFQPSRAAIREAVDGAGRQHWAREVAAWRAARGRGGLGGRNVAPVLAIEGQPPLGPGPAPVPAPRPVLALHRHGEPAGAKRPILVTITAEVLDVSGVIERVLASYGVPADRVKEIDHLAIGVDPAGSPGVTAADAAAGAGVVVIAISPKLDTYLRDLAARMTAQPGRPPAADAAGRPPPGDHPPGTEPAGGASPPGAHAQAAPPRRGTSSSGAIPVPIPDRLREMFRPPPKVTTRSDREAWEQVFAELLAMSDEDLTFFRILATHLTDDAARFLASIRLYKRLKAQHLAVLEQALQEASDDAGELETSRAAGPPAPVDPAAFRRWTREQKERDARARMEKLRNQQLADLAGNPGRTVKEMAKAVLRPDLQLADLNRSLAEVSRAKGGWEQAAKSATAASKTSAFFAGLLAFLAVIAQFAQLNPATIMSAAFAMMMSSAALALVESELYVKAAGEARTPAEYDRNVKAGAEAQVRATLAIAGMATAIAGGLIARIPLPGRLQSVGVAVRHARGFLARSVGRAWATIGKAAADKLREIARGLRELFDREARALASLRKQLDGMTHEQFFERLTADEPLRRSLGIDADTAQALAAMARSDHGKAGAKQLFDELRAALQTGTDQARQQLEAALRRVDQHAAAIDGAQTKDELERALATAETELDEAAVLSQLSEASAQQTAGQLAQLQRPPHVPEPAAPPPGEPTAPKSPPPATEPAPRREPAPSTTEQPATRPKDEPSREAPKESSREAPKDEGTTPKPTPSDDAPPPRNTDGHYDFTGRNGKQLRRDCSEQQYTGESEGDAAARAKAAQREVVNRLGDLQPCFVAGTPVLTVDGPLAIEEIAVGMQVVAMHPRSGPPRVYAVVATYHGATNTLRHITIGGQTITATLNHRFYVVDSGWIEARNLEIGDILVTPNSTTTVEAIVEEQRAHDVATYNLQVAEVHTYFVGGITPVLVHNDNPDWNRPLWWLFDKKAKVRAVDHDGVSMWQTHDEQDVKDMFKIRKNIDGRSSSDHHQAYTTEELATRGIRVETTPGDGSLAGRLQHGSARPADAAHGTHLSEAQLQKVVDGINAAAPVEKTTPRSMGCK